MAAAAETGAISQSRREELLPGPSVTPRREKELRKALSRSWNLLGRGCLETGFNPLFLLW